MCIILVFLGASTTGIQNGYMLSKVSTTCYRQVLPVTSIAVQKAKPRTSTAAQKAKPGTGTAVQRLSLK